VSRVRGYAGIALLTVALAGCGTTRRYVAEPPFTSDGSQTDARQAVRDFFGALTPPYSVRLCEADSASKQCNQHRQGIAARGVGGLLLPLTLYVTGMDVKSQRPSSDGFAFEASVDASVDRIAPLCGTVGGRIISRDNNTAAVQLRHFYCNWIVVGNVLVDADFSIDSLDPNTRVVTGFYRLTFHGTGNAAGSGYYRAVVADRSFRSSARPPSPSTAR